MKTKTTLAVSCQKKWQNKIRKELKLYKKQKKIYTKL